MMQDIPLITPARLLERYDTLLLDAYGVLVHGGGALPGAVELIGTLNRSDKSYYLLTNGAARLPVHSAVHYRRFGLELPAERIITSGSLIAPHFAAQNLHGARCMVLGTEDSCRYVSEAGGEVVSSSDDFEVLVVADQSGFSYLETLDAVLSTLYARLDRGDDITLILTNPDLIYPKGVHAYGYTAGAIALLIEAALGLRYPQREELHFTRLGKPHRAMFEEARRRAGSGRLVMIGDQLETDIRGARDYGLDSVLITAGVSGTAALRAVGAPQPTYCMDTLAG